MAGKKGRSGGPGRGGGNKPIAQGERTVTVSLRMTERQRDRLRELGGAGWVRGKIDRENEPNAEVRGASRLAGEASSREAATSTVVLGTELKGEQ